jgi:hypothetical protein
MRVQRRVVQLLGDVVGASAYSVTDDAMYSNLSSLPGAPHGDSADSGVAEVRN